jgi:hypothetical protein
VTAPHTCADHQIGVNIQGVYDGVLFWHCAVCGTDWHRFTEQDSPRLYAKATQYMNKETRWTNN